MFHLIDSKDALNGLSPWLSNLTMHQSQPSTLVKTQTAELHPEFRIH